MHNCCSPQNCTTLLYFDRLVGHSGYREQTPQFQEDRLQQQSISPRISNPFSPRTFDVRVLFSEGGLETLFLFLDGRKHARESTTDSFQNRVIPNLWLITVTSTITPGLIMNTSKERVDLTDASGKLDCTFYFIFLRAFYLFPIPRSLEFCRKTLFKASRAVF